MRKGFNKLKRSSDNLIDQLMSKLKMVKPNKIFTPIIVENNANNETTGESENSMLKISSKNMPILCDQLEQFIDYVKNATNLEYLIHDYPAILEERLEGNIQELEDLLREIKSAHINIQKQKMQQKMVNKEKITITKTLNKLKDNEIREMETIVSVFDKAMYSRWETVKVTRRTELLEEFLSDIKSKQLALENLNTLVSRRLTNLKIFPLPIKSGAKKKVITKAIPLPFPSFESSCNSMIPKPPPMPPLLLSPQSAMLPVSSLQIPTRALQPQSQFEQRRRIEEITE